MKKNWLYPCLSLTAVFTLATPAQADPVPGIVYIPTDDVELIPSGAAGDPRCTGLGNVHSGLGCLNVAEATTIAPFAGADELADDMRTSLADFDVTVTHDRPPKYLPFMMLLPSDDEFPESTSFTCTTGSIDCGAVHRRRIGRVLGGGSQQCTDPDMLHAALYAFGRLSGLEGIENPLDPMGYDSSDSEVQPINWSEPAHEFQDLCSPRSAQFGFNDRDEIILQQFECTNADHVGCENNEQNSVADLLEAYGAKTEDTEPPVIAITSPEDGATLPAGENVSITATVEDDDAFVGARWVLQGEGLVEMIEVDTWEFCTNRACRPLEGGLIEIGEAAWGWPDGNTSKPTDSSFAMPPAQLPAGTYTATFEAADMHGNVAEAVSVTFTVEAGTPDPDGTGGEGGGGEGGEGGDGGTFPRDTDGGTGDGPGSGGSGDGDGGGCSCTTGNDAGGALGAFALLFGLAGLRRRRS